MFIFSVRPENSIIECYPEMQLFKSFFPIFFEDLWHAEEALLGY